MLRGVELNLDESDACTGSGPQPEASAQDFETKQRVDKLTQGQLDCLRLVNEHLLSKEIAAELKISPHTVDQRIRQSLQILGVDRRAQAARIVAQYTGGYQRLIHQAPHIPAGAHSGHPGAAVSNQIRHADRAGGAKEVGFLTEQRPVSRPSLHPPFATRSNPRNEMSVGQRLFWVAAIAIGAAFAAGMYLAGLESLARLLNG